MTKYFTTAALVEAAKIAEKRGYNRQLDPDAIASLPDNLGWPVVFDMLHEHKGGKACEPHVRCMVLLPDLDDVTGRLTHRVMIDTDMDIFMALPTSESIHNNGSGVAA